MARKPRAISLAAAKALWEAKLKSIPSVFARLIYIAHLRQKKRKNEKPHVFLSLPASLCGRLIGDSHTACFSAWVSMDFQSNARDLEPYLDSLSLVCQAHHNYGRLSNRAFKELFRKLIPKEALPAEVERFLETLSVVQKGVMRTCSTSNKTHLRR